MSKKTWAAQEGLDFEQEQKNLQLEAEAARKANPQAGGQPHPGQHSRDAVESLVQEVWDPAKHPRGGDPHFPQRFSDGWGHGAPAKHASSPRHMPSPGANSGERSADSGGSSDGNSGGNSAAAARRPSDVNRVLLNPADSGDARLQSDAKLLDSFAAGIFQHEPIEHWNAEALHVVLKLQKELGRPLSGDLQNKFLDYVHAQQANAKLRRYIEDSARKLATLKRDRAGFDNETSEVLLDMTQMGLDLAGVFDPTPVSDGANTLLSLGNRSRGAILDAVREQSMPKSPGSIQLAVYGAGVVHIFLKRRRS